ncbi:hypothetical protein L914_21012 [Phytophthora nicotianae]|uniref:Uncharacterized protein n=2 Tax=Phytophthora nicotianae TaxID=4792 RepID=V9DYJ3_PHYNI|nr:hypothetical protein F443_21877 [Phytophthora nicotianae P1569]ETM31408.1 hypothetical protein L914_21012 [Phytophthora nicotianae]
MAELKESTIADAIRHTEERIQLASKAQSIIKITDGPIYRSSQSNLVSFQPVQPATPDLQDEEDDESKADIAECSLATPSVRAPDFTEIRVKEQEDVSGRLIQELGQLLSAAKRTPKPDKMVKLEELRVVCMEEQAKVTARAVARSRVLISAAKKTRVGPLKAYNGIDIRRNQLPLQRSRLN